MKVHELIALLNKHNPESVVVVDGYEAGYTELQSVSTRSLRSLISHGDKWDNSIMGELDDGNEFVAVYLPRP